MEKESISEKLRRWAKESKNKNIYPTSLDIKEKTGNTSNAMNKERGLFSYIADEIDKEQKAIVEAQKDSAHHIMKTYAEDAGMPMEDGETINKWLDRWFIKRPCFEGGEPVEWRTKDVKWMDRDFDYYFNGIDEGGVPLAIGEGGVITTADMTDDGFVKRRNPKVLDADGVEIKVGDTVWLESNPTAYTVVWFNEKLVISHDQRGYKHQFPHPELLTHREPDSQERINEDEKLNANAYCSKYNLTPHLSTEGRQTKYKHLFNRQRALTERGA